MKQLSIFTTVIIVLNSLLSLGQNRTQKIDFKGKYLISVSDADMLASAYVDGKLGPKEGTDVISVIPLSSNDLTELKSYEVYATNSVAGPPSAVEVTPDGKYAFVIETFTPRPEHGNDLNHTFSDLKIGNKLSVFNLSNPKNPQLTYTLEVGLRPDAISINPQGNRLLVTFNPEGGIGKERPLALADFSNGKVGELVYPIIPNWVAGDRLINAEWHPSKPIISLLNETRASVSLLEVNGDELKPWGNIVQIEKAPYNVKFSPNGKFLIINSLYWGADVDGIWVEAPRGSILSIKLESGENADGSPKHSLINRALTGVSPEGLSVSPDGNFLVTTNLERSYLPYEDNRITWYSSISLFGFNQNTGEITKYDDFAYDGILPEAAVFDNSSKFLAVATFDHFNDAKKGGSIDFWRVTQDPFERNRKILVKTEHEVPVTRGAHSMVIVR